MVTIKPTEVKTADLQNQLQHAIAPRPICFASTIDKGGKVNLSPFSFFNMFSVNPPICVFSPSRRVRDNTIKHTLENLQEVPECVINIVNYPIVQQTSLASTEYPRGVNEFRKAGLTELKSQLVKPPRVGESPVQLECIVREIISLGDLPGAGNLVLTEIILIHIKDEILDTTGKIDQAKIDLVARLGGDWYCRVTAANLFKVPKPLTTLGIGIDALPEEIRNSKVLTGNDLGKLGNVEKLPTMTEIESIKEHEEVKAAFSTLGEARQSDDVLHQIAKSFLDKDEILNAWKVLLLKR